MKIDHQLIQDCIDKQGAAQNKLYKELFSYLMGICMRYKPDYDTAGASLNEIFLKILNHLEKFEKQEAFFGWVKRIAVNHLIDEYRKDKRDQARVTYTDKEFNTSVNLSVNHSSDQEMEAEYLLEMIRSLPEVTGKVFNLFAIEGYKHREIAELLDINENTSKWHLREARIKLKALLEIYNEKV